MQHYDFTLGLTDLDNNIDGAALITLQFLKDTPEFSLDLTARNKEGKGMTVSSIKEGHHSISFYPQTDQHLHPAYSRTRQRQANRHPENLHGTGIPADGLIIANNKFGSRGFFDTIQSAHN